MNRPFDDLMKYIETCSLLNTTNYYLLLVFNCKFTINDTISSELLRAAFFK